MTSTLDLDPARLALLLGRPRREGARWRATCPSCGQHTFTVGLSDDGQTYLVKCWGGCSQWEVIERLKAMDLWPTAGRGSDLRQNGHQPAPATAQSPAGEVATNGASAGGAGADPLSWLSSYCAVPDSFVAALPIERRGEWVAFTFPSGAAKRRKVGTKDIRWDIPQGGARPALWPLPSPDEALPEGVWILESETDAIVARRLGLPAYAGTAGASTPLRPAEAEALRQRGVRRATLLYDADAAGREGAQKQAEVLARAGIEVAVVDLAEAGLVDVLAGQKDLRDSWRAAVARGESPERLRQALEEAVRPWAEGPAPGPADGGEGPAGEGAGPAEAAAVPFPLASLPEPHRTYVAQAARALDCDPALVAVPYLAIAAGIIGHRWEIYLTRSWRERAILWTAVVAPPGSAKSPALRLAMEPMLTLQHEAYERWRAATDAAEEARRAYEAARAEAKRHGGAVPPPPEPPEELEHYYTADCTLEAITRMLGHPRSRTPGLTVVRDELVSWVKAFDAYSAKGERQVWLSLWAGAPVKSDRAHRDSFVIPRPAVSVTGGIAPDLLGQLEAEAGQRDGFLERLLFAMPPCRPLGLVDAEVDPEVAQAVRAALARLRRRPGPGLGHWCARSGGPGSGGPGSGDGSGGPGSGDGSGDSVASGSGPGAVRLSPAAFAAYSAWHAENVAMQERAAGLLQGFFAKLPAHVGRLCLLLHALALPEDPAAVPVSVETMASAIALGEYFRAHFERVARHFGVSAQVQDTEALRLLRTLARLGGSATGRALDDAGLRAGPERERAIQRLAAAGLLHVETVPHDGPGRPAVRYTLTAGNLSNLSNLSQGVRAAADGGVGMGTDGPPQRPGAVANLSNLSNLSHGPLSAAAPPAGHSLSSLSEPAGEEGEEGGPAEPGEEFFEEFEV